MMTTEDMPCPRCACHALVRVIDCMLCSASAVVPAALAVEYALTFPTRLGPSTDALKRWLEQRHIKDASP